MGLFHSMFLLGVNYWPRRHNIKMWKEWNSEDLAKDLDQIKELGIRAVRFFILAEDFFDSYGGVNALSLARLKQFMAMLKERGIEGFPTLIVGHMSGRNWAIPWAPDWDVYNPAALERGVRAVSEVVKSLRGHEALGGWILSNELSLVRRARSRDEALALLRAYSSAVKGLGGQRPFSSGDVPDSYLQETPNVRGLVDWVGPHLYLYDADAVRHAYLYPAYMELFSNDGDLPVLLEEFGFSTYQFSEGDHARFINDVLWSALAHGAAGAFIWCFSDFAQEADPPYEWRLLELGFGLVRADGSLKPAAEAVRAFAKDLERLEALGLGEYKRPRAEVGVVVPFYIYRDYEFVQQIWRANPGVKPALQALALSFMAGLRASAVYELDREKLKSKRLLVFPSIATALATTWRAAYEAGATIYASAFRAYGGVWALHEAATHLWRELFGVENATLPGSIGVEYSGIFRMKFVGDFGPIKAGEELEFTLEGPLYTYAVRPKDAEVVAVDHRNRPVLVATKRSVLSTIPVELLLYSMPHVDWLRGYHRLYLALAQTAGVEPRLRALDPRIEVSTFEGAGGRLVVAINHSYEQLETPLLGGAKSAEKVAGQGAVEGTPPMLRLGPKEAVAFLAR